MFVELQAAVEDAGGRVISPDTLNEVETVRELDRWRFSALINQRKSSMNRAPKTKKMTNFIFLRSFGA